MYLVIRPDIRYPVAKKHRISGEFTIRHIPSWYIPITFNTGYFTTTNYLTPLKYKQISWWYISIILKNGHCTTSNDLNRTPWTKKKLK